MIEVVGRRGLGALGFLGVRVWGLEFRVVGLRVLEGFRV